jgi:hypothetical protein
MIQPECAGLSSFGNSIREFTALMSGETRQERRYFSADRLVALLPKLSYLLVQNSQLTGTSQAQPNR